MQRAFTARTEQEARQVPLWAGFGKLCFSLMVVLPGLAAGRLFPALTQSQHFDQALPKTMVELYGPAMFGLGMTAIVASLTSGLAANVCAFASVTTNDIYRSYIRQNENDRHYLRFGRLATVLAIMVSLGASYINFFFHNLMEHVQLIFSVFGAPFWAIFLLGMSTRRTDARGAICGFLSGTAVAVLHLIAITRGWIHYGSNMNADFHSAIYAFVVAVSVGWFTSDRRKTDRKRHLVFHWRTGVTGPGRAALFTLSAILAAACVALNIYWR
jgi:solute:Na+ symporter, SSS family